MSTVSAESPTSLLVADGLVTVNEAARLLGLSRTTIYKLMNIYNFLIVRSAARGAFRGGLWPSWLREP
jgi:hypothetical protein